MIGSSQLGKIFAVSTPAEQWWRKLGELAVALPTTNPRALLIGVATVLVVIAIICWAPGVLLAVASATAFVAVVGWKDQVPVIGEVPAGIPVPSLPDVVPGDVFDLLGAGASVAQVPRRSINSSTTSMTAVSRLVLARVRTSLRTTMRQLGFEHRLGPECFHLHIRDAVADFMRPTAAEEAAAADGVTVERPGRNRLPGIRPEADDPQTVPRTGRYREGEPTGARRRAADDDSDSSGAAIQQGPGRHGAALATCTIIQFV